MKIELPSTPSFSEAAEIVAELKRHGKKAFFIGGCVRDMLLGAAPHDIDIATSATPEEIQRIFPKTYAVGASFGVVTVLRNGLGFETATLREERDYMDGRRPETVHYTDNEVLDVIRRDFTVNGLLCDPASGEVFDHVGGIDDLRRGILRTIGDPDRRFSEDYLRILRAVRFTVRLGFELDSDTREAARRHAEKLSVLSAERVRDEVEKMLLGPHPGRAFELMRELGILRVILPEIDALHGVEQPPAFHPEGDVFAHTMIMLERMCHPTRELAWSVLLHDVGKPATFHIHEDGVIHFYGHEAVGGRMAESILTRLRCSASLVRNVSAAVANHMKFASVDRMKRSTWLKMIAAPTFPTDMELNRVDCASCHGKMEGWLLMLDRWRALDGAPAVPPLPVNGSDLIAVGYTPGPALGRMLNTLRDEFLEGRLTARDALLAFAKEHLEAH
ncbi:MAG TPA: phosphohydrolase [Lentisphaeria bacterium]|nr:phosphohydrolase [Lentisphaeria bacterium]